ncbi:hypothetical protein ACU8KH_04469 [Lachancea thermotolerans]
MGLKLEAARKRNIRQRVKSLSSLLRSAADIKKFKKSTTAGFEPARAEPKRFLILRLNHSAKLPFDISTLQNISYKRYKKHMTLRRFSIILLF